MLILLLSNPIGEASFEGHCWISNFIPFVEKKLINFFFHLRAKKLKSLNQLKIHLRFKWQQITHKSIVSKYIIYGSIFIKNAVHSHKFAILCAIIKETRLAISKTEKELFDIHLKLKLPNLPNFTSMVLNFWYHVENISSKHSYKHNAIFACLIESSVSLVSADLVVNKNAVVNLSVTNISETQYSVLKLNTNFAISEKPFLLQLIATVEKVFKRNKIKKVISLC